MQEDAHLHMSRALGGAKTLCIDGVVATFDPALVRALLISREHSIGRSWLYRLVAWMMPVSDGIVFMADEEWRKRHAAFTPLFQPSQLRQYTGLFAESALREAAALVAPPAPAPGEWRGASLLSEPTRNDCPCGHAAGMRRAVMASAPLSALVLPWNTHAPGAPARSTALVPIIRPRDDLLAFVRGIAMRNLLGWGFGLRLEGAGVRVAVAGDACTCLPSELARVFDEYSRTAFDNMPRPHTGPLAGWSYAAHWLRNYAHLQLLGGKVRALSEYVLTRTAIAPAPADRPITADYRNAGAPALPASTPTNFLQAMREAGFTTAEMCRDVNHFHGAHKAIALVTTAALVELSIPHHARWRSALVAEFAAVCGLPDAATPLADLSRDAYSPTGADGAGGGRRWRLPTKADLDGGALPVLQRVWRETLRCHVVSLGVMRK